ncbi:hypothetical protein [Conexibacter woesei]|uniref:Uncharacterized protein n=1 Tax=Conexibacter woesei (strain DSM 14684 / CCUG 47730 / CIP 108061 / JCM 11494 / NBRC 100937 / ID131577) TaxID=469383 RepID=D3FA74_CONWI|nr:hypothetical protein [Conexibacter woesei]ADB53169.1 hypothetical protein Cwoe_4756 [Conexibacter woesei DSM 14684]
MGRTVTIRARAETRDELNRLAAAVGLTVPELLDQLAERERDRRLLRSGLETLASMDGVTRDAYMAEFGEWDDAPLAESA